MNQTANHTQKNSPHYFLFLAFAILVSGNAIYLFYAMAHLPYTGEYSLLREDTNFEVLAVDPGSPADLAGLREGDRILQMGDQKFFRRLEPGRSCQVIFLRGTSTLTTHLTPGQPIFPYNTMSGFMLGLLLLFFGLTIYLKKPLDSAARIFYLLTASLSLISTAMFSFQALINLVSLSFMCISYFIPQHADTETATETITI